MFDEVISAVIQALKEKGIPAAAQYRGELLREDRLVCIGLRSGRLLPSGAGEYLGLRGDRELFGFRAEISVAADIFASCAGECVSLLDKLGLALSCLPGGLRGVSLSCGEMEADAETGMYRMAAEIAGTVYFSANLDEDTGEFTDFTLRGALK